MDKETLQKKIESGDTVWAFSWATGEKRIVELNLQENEPEIDNYLLYFWDKDLVEHRYDLESIFATKEEAEWKLKFGNIERTERFEPPMWEEIKDTYEFHFTCQNYTHKRTDGIIETVYTPQCFMFYVHKSEQPNYNRVMIRNYRIYAINIEVFDEPATKENYEKACGIVRDLFKGKNEKTSRN